MPFDHSSTAEEVLAGVDLTGKHALVTGANTGIGAETARALAARGAAVSLAVRDIAKGEAAADRIRSDHPGADLRVGTLDLSSLAGVREYADRLQARGEQLDILIANAGVMAIPFGRTLDGFERQFGVNHLGHFVLVNKLVPSLTPASGTRVVVLSSGAHRRSNVDLDDPNFDRTPYDPWIAYGRSKTANILFALELGRRLSDRGVRAYAVHPGVVRGTELNRYLDEDEQAAVEDTIQRLPASRVKSTPQGAATSVWAATADVGTGVYCEDCQVVGESHDPRERPARESDRLSRYAVDPETAAALWTLSERMVGERFDAS